MLLLKVKCELTPSKNNSQKYTPMKVTQLSSTTTHNQTWRLLLFSYFEDMKQAKRSKK